MFPRLCTKCCYNKQNSISFPEAFFNDGIPALSYRDIAPGDRGLSEMFLAKLSHADFP